jgi:hypothetical protein
MNASTSTGYANTDEQLSKLRQISAVSKQADFQESSDSRPIRGAPYANGKTDRHIYVVNTSTIPFHTVENMIQASAHAWHIGKPLLHHLTIKWLTGDWSLHQDMQTLLAKWLSRHSAGAFYIWAKEGNKGPHSHFLIHLRTGLSGNDCRQFIIKTLKRLLRARSLPRGTVQCRGVNSFGSRFEHVKRRTAYICKGGGAGVRAFLGVKKYDLAFVPGKQAGVSESLSEAARRRAGGCLPSGCRTVTHEMKKVGGRHA